MKHVVAFGVSKGESAVFIYNHHGECDYEGKLIHTREGFKELDYRIRELTRFDVQVPEIVFEATGVYLKGLERFLCNQGYAYCRMNPLQANLQMSRIAS